MEKYIIESEQRIPVYCETEVLVVGEGPAGYCAAVSAARGGAKTVLMERYGYLGGMATGGYVLLFDCLCDRKGKRIVKGLVEETVERLEKLGGIIGPSHDEAGSCDPESVYHWGRYGADGGENKVARDSPVVDPEMLKCVAFDMARESGVKLLTHAWFSKAIMDGDRVTGAIFESKSGRMAVLAKIVIDCTGDGDVFASAGAEYRMGNLPIGLVFLVGNVQINKAEAFMSDVENRRKLSASIKQIGGISGGYSFGDLPMGFYMRSAHDDVVWFSTPCIRAIRSISRISPTRRSIFARP